MNKLRIIYALAVLISLSANVFLLTKNLSLDKELNDANKAIEVRQNNGKIINFARLFVSKILKADKEVDFETRLQLENSIRDLGDDELFNQWNKFVNSKDEKEAQKEVVNLLEMLLKKIRA